jgi:hypothetical protein
MMMGFIDLEDVDDDNLQLLIFRNLFSFIF